MTTHLPGFGAVLMLLVVSGCADSEVSSETVCSLTSTITFDGKEYISVHGPGIARDEKRKGERLGTGQGSACRGQGEPVTVYRVHGLEVEQSVFTDVLGLMARWNQDGSIE